MAWVCIVLWGYMTRQASSPQSRFQMILEKNSISFGRIPPLSQNCEAEDSSEFFELLACEHTRVQNCAAVHERSSQTFQKNHTSLLSQPADRVWMRNRLV